MATLTPMNGFMREIKNAFAVEKPGAATPTDAQREIIERVCREVVRRRMSMPALTFLEMTRPLNYVGAQAMHFFTPLVSVVTDAKGFEQFAGFLEKRGSIAYMCARIEAMEDARRTLNDNETTRGTARDDSTEHGNR